MTQQSTKCILRNKPSGLPSTNDFTTTTEQAPRDESELQQGEILVKLVLISVDPYLRMMINHQELNQPVVSDAIAQIVASKDEGYKIGEYLRGWFPWKEYCVLTRKDFHKEGWSDIVRIGKQPDIPLEKYLNVFLPVILSAAYGVFKADLQPGKVVLVSGAAGAVGSLVGQFAKMKGCTVIGIAGSDEKCTTIQKEFNFDAAINYKTCGDYKEAIAKAAPKGVDVYFDCVGGDIFDAAVLNLNRKGHVVIVGTISSYNDPKPQTGVRLCDIILRTGAKIEGHMFMEHKNKFQEIEEEMLQWYREGKIKSLETVKSGPISKVPDTFIGLFHGENTGKMIHKITE